MQVVAERVKKIIIITRKLAFSFLQIKGLSESQVLSNTVQQIVRQYPYLMDHISAMRITDGSSLSIGESMDLLCRVRQDPKDIYLLLDGLDESEEVSHAVVMHLLAIKPPLRVLIASRPAMMVSQTFKDCVKVHIDSGVRSSDHLESVKKRIEKNPRIAGYLDHNPEKIVNAAKLILGQSDGLYVFLKIPLSDLTGVFPLPLWTSLAVILTDFL